MKIIKKVLWLSAFMVIALLNSNAIKADALENGAYLVPVTSSYVNPETGSTADGGSNVALGQSMVESIVNSQALVEVENGNTYVTIRLGLMSSVSSTSFQIQTSSGGGYTTVSSSQTSSNSSNDTKDFRFQVNSTELYISPVLYVDPMGRNVQFFIKLNTAQAVSGSGDFVSTISTNSSSNSGSSNSSSNSGTTSSSTGNNQTATGSSSQSTTSDATSSQDGTTNSTVADSAVNETEEETAAETTTEENSETPEETEEATEVTSSESIEDLLDGVTGITEYIVDEDTAIDGETEETSDGVGKTIVFTVLGIVAIGVIGGGVFYYKKSR